MRQIMIGREMKVRTEKTKIKAVNYSRTAVFYKKAHQLRVSLIKRIFPLGKKMT